MKKKHRKDVGFAIRCPYCFQWSRWENKKIKDFLVQSAKERDDIIEKLKDSKTKKFKHSKMLQCQDPKGNCPLPFQAFICKGQKEAHEFIEKIPTWTLRRAFILYKSNCVDKWTQKKYSGIIFRTYPTPRLRNIELENLIERQMLSRATLGMGIEINDTFTVFAAKTYNFRDKKKKIRENIYWVPLEPYGYKSEYYPPKFNLFCKICRKAVISKLLKEFDGKIEHNNCNKFSKNAIVCKLREIYCSSKDWNHCPLFLEARLREDPCYISDLEFIKSVETRWLKNQLKEPISYQKSEEPTTHTGYLTRKCWAGFTEIAAPIVVHNILIAVAMGGQFLIQNERIPSVDSFIRKSPFLKDYEKELNFIRELWTGERKPKNEEETFTKNLYIHKGKLQTKIKKLIVNADRIASIANTRYREIRNRYENIFREETLGRIDLLKGDPLFFQESIREILPRIREFWAFDAVYLLKCEKISKELYVLAFSHKYRETKFFNKPIEVGIIYDNFDQTHPQPFLFSLNKKSFTNNKWIMKFRTLFDNLLRNDTLAIPIGSCYFLILAPFREEIYAFVFASREKDQISPLESPEKGQLSQIGQDAILETCTRILDQYREFYHQETRLKDCGLEAAAASKFNIAHEISNKIIPITSSFEKLKGSLPNKKNISLNSMSKSLNIIKDLCDRYREQDIVTKQDKTLIDLNELAQEIIGKYKAKNPTKIFINKLGSKSTKIFGYESLIRLIFIYLLDNAICYTRKSKKIICSIKPTQKYGGKFIQISLLNEGQGIKQKNKKKIFEFGYSTRENHSGLGLTFVKKYVTEHNGTITENGIPGFNANFDILLPLK